MLYSDLYLGNSRKYSFVLAPIALIMVMGFFALFFHSSSAPTRASNNALQEQYIVNLAPSEFGVVWKIEKPANSWIIYGESPDHLNTIAYDDRDVTDNKLQSTYHIASLKNLKPDSSYFYKIISDDKVIEANGGNAFEIHTPIVFSISSATKPAYGTISQENGSAAEEALVILRYPEAVPLVALTKSKGEWIIPFQQLINSKTDKPISIDPVTKVTIDIIYQDKKSAEIRSLVQNTSPIPEKITLGKDYSFLNESNVLPAHTQINNNQQNLDIIFPKEGSIIPGKPLIKGSAAPNITLSLLLDSSKSKYNIQVDPQGDWSINLPTVLPAGSHSITVQTADATDSQIITRNFTVAKSGEQVLGDATGSATPTVMPTTIPTATALPTVIVPTTNLYLTPTNAALPQTGATPGPFFIGSIVLIVIGAGLLFVL